MKEINEITNGDESLIVRVFELEAGEVYPNGDSAKVTWWKNKEGEIYEVHAASSEMAQEIVQSFQKRDRAHTLLQAAPYSMGLRTANLFNYQKLAALGRRFPSLQDAPFEPWEPDALADWAMKKHSGAQHAVRFLLSIWNRYEYDLGPFNCSAAIGCWDDGHRRAFQSWAIDPFFC